MLNALSGFVVLSLAAGGAAGGFYLLQQQHALDQRLTAVEQLLQDDAKAPASVDPAGDDTSSNPVEAPADDDGASTDESSAHSAFEGVWTGTLVETKYQVAGGHNCYGAQDNNPTLTIESVDDLGKVHCSLNVLIHNHKPADLTEDVDSAPQDKFTSFEGLVSTMEDDWFELEMLIPNSQETVKVTVEKIEQTTSNATLQMTVEANNYRDIYQLTRS